MGIVHELRAAAHHFGGDAAREKQRLIDGWLQRDSCSPRDLPRVQSVVLFLLAYPDNAGVLRRATELSVALARWADVHLQQGRGDALEDSGLGGTTCTRVLSFELARKLTRAPSVKLAGTCQLEIDWSGLKDYPERATLLHEILGAVVSPVEAPALDDIEISPRQWLEGLANVPGQPQQSALNVLLDAFAGCGASDEHRDALFESCEVPLRLELERGRSELRYPIERVHFQRRAIPREAWPLAPRIRKPLPVAPPVTQSRAQRDLAIARHAMVSRELEIYPLTHADERDVRWFECGRGVSIMLAGVVPSRRCAFEALFYYLVCKNGVPIAYGPASPVFGTCEMGINFFEEFRGAESRFVYTQVMRVLFHALGVRHFYVTPYGMGKRNPAALASGAFWFYRKLGFTSSSTEVAALAEEEEARRAKDPSHRSDRRMLLRLSGTAVSLDLSGGDAMPVDMSALALAVSRASRSAGNAALYATHASRQVAKALGVRDLRRWSADERASLTRMAPALALIEDLDRWPARDRNALIAVVRAKAAASEVDATLRMTRHPRLASALREFARGAAAAR